jgi:hypothetical protein
MFMTDQRWLGVSLLSILCTTLVIAAFHYETDIFGVFRDTRGRVLSGYVNERTSKYLLNQRYVRENFDALLVGTSVSANFDVDLISAARVYNESMGGSNAVEERILVDEALKTGHFKFALCVISPSLTESANLKEGDMGRPPRRVALGSVNILREEWMALMVKLNREPRTIYPNGDLELGNPNTPYAPYPLHFFNMNPEALSAYHSMLRALHQHNVRVIFIIPPTGDLQLGAVRERLLAYRANTKLIQQGDSVIDFDGPMYENFRKNTSNFEDGIHLSSEGARELSISLAHEVDWALHPPAIRPSM